MVMVDRDNFYRINSVAEFADTAGRLPLQPELPLGILREIGKPFYRGKTVITESKQRELRTKHPSELFPEEIARSAHAWLGLLNETNPTVVGVVNVYMDKLARHFHSVERVRQARYLRGEQGRLITIVRTLPSGLEKLQVIERRGYGLSDFSRRAFPKNG